MYYGDSGKRIVAVIIDSIFLSIIGWILLLVLRWVTFASAPGSFWYGPYRGLMYYPFFRAYPFFFQPLFFYIYPIITGLYYVLMEGGSWHATLGKRFMGLYVADYNGNGITYTTAILRLIGKSLSGLTLGIGYLIAFFSDTKQGLHDLVAKTYVLNDQFQVENSKPTPNANGAPELIGINGPLAGRSYRIGDNGLVIGRDSVSCQVVIPSSQAHVARTHCYVTYNPMSGMFVLNDRNSRNGTYLANGRRISSSQPVALKSGDRFYLATSNNTFEVR